MEVGVRDLRDNLSRYLERARAGEEVVVTDHGRAVARIVAFDVERPIDRLVREGKVTPASARERKRPRPAAASGSVSDFVAEQRR